MKKVLSFTLVSLALAALASPAQANFGGSVRGDVGMLGSQVPFLTVTTGIAPTSSVVSTTYLSDRKEGDWDFTGRLFIHTGCVPCSNYIAGSWQGSNHTVYTHNEDILTTSNLSALIPVRVNTIDSVVSVPTDSPFTIDVGVKNKFSKAKLGMGFDLIKTNCFAFTMEIGGNYLDAELDVEKAITVTQTAAQGPGSLVVPPGNRLESPNQQGLPYNYLINSETHQKTEGVGLYASFKAEYKFASSCLGNCFSVYGKAEVADIIGRQNYSSSLKYINEYTPAHTPLVSPAEYGYEDYLNNRRYDNIVEVDLEAAFVYSPCFTCWDNMNVSFALGVRTDSFVNLFSTPVNTVNQSLLSLTRPTLFIEVGMKV